MSVDVSRFKIGLIQSVDECGSCRKGGKALKACTVDIGESSPITVVTSATIRVGSRIIVAPTGSIFIDEEGESIEVTKASVGGVISEGMLCDSRMLGWSGGGKGVAVQIPDEFKIGSSPPASKPRPKLDESLEIPESSISGLYKKKLTKEEKKKKAEEKRKSRRAAKSNEEKGVSGV